MPPPNVRVEGLKELSSAIRRAKDAELGKRLRQVNKTIAQHIVERALPNVPRRSGRLASSVKALATQTSASVKAGTPSRTPYAAVIHWGWPRRHIESRPFLTDAADSVDHEVAGEYESGLADVFRAFNARP